MGGAHSSENPWPLGFQSVGVVSVDRPPTRWTDDIKQVAGSRGERPRIVELGTPYKRYTRMFRSGRQLVNLIMMVMMIILYCRN
ncbi:jg17479 [Pararge aegeria aegeria]|uniref:Jg17479 protein n=1 Tax=Pararge aegeria aegeria TaxID=348720 RepID=A0A8S4RL92_9NEOP|nr:jg17479 [Pararge aegeria aegeria]